MNPTRSKDSRGPFYISLSGAKFRYISGDAVSRNLAKTKAMPKRGEGIISDIKERFSLKPRTGAPPGIRKLVDDYRGVPITKIQIARAPVQSGIQKFFDALSLGNFSKVKKRLNYNDVYHNYLLVELANGKKIRLEKNQVVQSSDATADDYKVEHRSIPVDKEIDLNHFIDNAARHNPKEFWHYDPSRKNCQNFTEDLIRSNNFDKDITDEKTKEILEPQDGVALIDSLGRVKGLPERVTDLAAGFDRALNGSGLKIRGGKITVTQLFKLANR